MSVPASSQQTSNHSLLLRNRLTTRKMMTTRMARRMTTRMARRMMILRMLRMMMRIKKMSTCSLSSITCPSTFSFFNRFPCSCSRAW